MVRPLTVTSCCRHFPVSLDLCTTCGVTQGCPLFAVLAPARPVATGANGAVEVGIDPGQRPRVTRCRYFLDSANLCTRLGNRAHIGDGGPARTAPAGPDGCTEPAPSGKALAALPSESR